MQHEQGHIVRRFSSLVQHRADAVGNRLNGPLENVAPVHLEEVPAGSNQFRSCGVQSATGRPVQHAAARPVCSQLVTHQPLSSVTGFEDDGTGSITEQRCRTLIVRTHNAAVDVCTDDQSTPGISGGDELSSGDE